MKGRRCEKERDAPQHDSCDVGIDRVRQLGHPLGRCGNSGEFGKTLGIPLVFVVVVVVKLEFRSDQWSGLLRTPTHEYKFAAANNTPSHRDRAERGAALALLGIGLGAQILWSPILSGSFTIHGAQAKTPEHPSNFPFVVCPRTGPNRKGLGGANSQPSHDLYDGAFETRPVQLRQSKDLRIFRILPFRSLRFYVIGLASDWSATTCLWRVDEGLYGPFCTPSAQLLPQRAVDLSRGDFATVSLDVSPSQYGHGEEGCGCGACPCTRGLRNVMTYEEPTIALGVIPKPQVFFGGRLSSRVRLRICAGSQRPYRPCLLRARFSLFLSPSFPLCVCSPPSLPSLSLLAERATSAPPCDGLGAVNGSRERSHAGIVLGDVPTFLLAAPGASRMSSRFPSSRRRRHFSFSPFFFSLRAAVHELVAVVRMSEEEIARLSLPWGVRLRHSEGPLADGTFFFQFPTTGWVAFYARKEGRHRVVRDVLRETHQRGDWEGPDTDGHGAYTAALEAVRSSSVHPARSYIARRTTNAFFRRIEPNSVPFGTPLRVVPVPASGAQSGRGHVRQVSGLLTA
ncbi:hypothetical protein B0H14DRAFT_3127261 [Mycena olivaceomarginata]|nr:hypothetical protein B0H14DRAFT_3127261 [Mycena olivaceomarginata]